MQKSAGLYIHIPFCKKKCNYCDFPSYPGMDEYWEVYTQTVMTELSLKEDEFKDVLVKTVFIGGGTPSLIPYEYIVKIIDTVYKKYNVIDGCEKTLESNPGTLTDAKLRSYREAGINRLSIGLQACQDELLKKLGRIHTWKDFETAIDLAQKHGFVNINADIIFGIPDQTFESWSETLDKVLSLDLKHISCYSLKIEEGTIFGRMQQEGNLVEVSDELDRQMYHYAIERFDMVGFGQYELSNFAKPQYLCQHNMNYWERGEYIGIGAGAHSFIGNRRYANTSEVLRYMDGVNKGALVLSEDNRLSADEGLSEKIILGLRLNRGVNINEVSKEFGLDVEKRYESSLKLLLGRKLVERCGSMIRLTKIGMDLANLVFVEFI